MFRTIEDFSSKWKYESAATLKLFSRLSDSALEHRVTPDGRSLRDLAWHIATTLTELPGSAGLAVEGPQHTEPAPAVLSDIVAAYEQASASLTQGVQTEWSNDKLSEPVVMYGETWTYGYALQALCDHQAHHRGQMTVLMRQAGLTVPGIYGPSKEEWAEMGMEAMA